MAAPAAAPAKPALAPVMQKAELDEIFSDPAADLFGSKPAPPPQAPPVKPGIEAPPPAEEPAAAAPAEVPAEEPAPAGEAPVEGEVPVEAPEVPVEEEKPLSAAEVEAKVYKDILAKILGPKGAEKPAADPAPAAPEPAHIVTLRQVAALTEEQYEALYDKHVENAQTQKDPKGYRKAEMLAGLRAQAPAALYEYDARVTRERERDEEMLASQKARGNALLAAVKAKYPDMDAYKPMMLKLSRADEAAQREGNEPVYESVEDIYHAAKALTLRGKTPPLTPAAAAAKAAIVGGSPALRAGAPVPAKTPAKAPDILDDIFAPDRNPFA